MAARGVRAGAAIALLLTLTACRDLPDLLPENPPQAAQEWVPEEHLDDIAGAAVVVERHATQRWPEEFAGIWIDEDEQTITIAFRSGAENKVAQLRRDIDQPHRLVAATSQHSLQELFALQERMIDDRAALIAGDPPRRMPDAIVATGGRYDLDVSVQTGAVVVHADPLTEELEAAFLDYYGTTAIVFEQGVASPTG